MSDEKLKRQAVKLITEELSAQGKVIEGGWAAFQYLTLKDASELQKTEMRKAFFCGAQHLWGSIFEILDPDHEPTEKDMKRMSLIDAELRKFIEGLRAQGGFAA